MAEWARQITAAESRSISALAPLCASLEFQRAVALCLGCRGRVVISGLGKSGLAGQRIAASLRSTGTAALFLHPVEAAHGDLGLVARGDVALLISKSGENPEVFGLIPLFRRIGVPIIALTAAGGSEIARSADLVLDIGPVRELAPLPEVPIVSTLLFQTVGDVLTVVLFRLRGFTAEDFAFLHPGGILGRRVTRRVRDAMHAGDELPLVRENTLLTDALVEIMEKRLGMTCVVGPAGRLEGVLTDGDLKRILHRTGGSIQDLRVGEVMTRGARTIAADELLVTALARMENNQPSAITSLVIVDEEGCPEGVLHIHDCLKMPPER
ncbi:MAG: KpsF/GutQ family sugar-phosphate isomerase [Candidatus Eisenbacteria bacterium]|nr:KpsF/GutQ family sugar-phosphate isomerase [Candidatus Eisenbacteria bacterium]